MGRVIQFPKRRDINTRIAIASIVIDQQLMNDVVRERASLQRDVRNAFESKLITKELSQLIAVTEMAESARNDPDHVCMYTVMAEARGGPAMCVMCLRTAVLPKKVR